MKSNFWQYCNWVIKGDWIDFEIEEKNVFFLKGLNVLLGSASTSNFWQYFNWVVKGNWIDVEIEKNMSFFIKGLKLLYIREKLRNPIVLQYLTCVKKENSIDFEIVFFKLRV